MQALLSIKNTVSDYIFIWRMISLWRRDRSSEALASLVAPSPTLLDTIRKFYSNWKIQFYPAKLKVLTYIKIHCIHMMSSNWNQYSIHFSYSVIIIASYLKKILLWFNLGFKYLAFYVHTQLHILYISSKLLAII